MDQDKSLDELAAALGRIHPTAPDLSPGTVMFEAGRQAGTAEATKARAHSLKVWKSVAAGSIVLALASLSIWLVPRDPSDNIIVRDDSTNREIETKDDQKPAPSDFMAMSTTQGDDVANSDFAASQLAQAFFVSDQSPLARRQQMLRQGVSGLPEITTNQNWPVTTSFGRGELMNQLLENESL